MPPNYRLPILGLLGFAGPYLLGLRRSFARDGYTVMRANPYPRRLEGLENVPRAGTFVAAMNHYNRTGLRPWICAMIISAHVADLRPGQKEMSWVFAAEMERFTVGPLSLPPWLIRWMLRRIARVYDLIALPREWRRPMERATALRRTVKVLEQTPVGLAPEGDGSGVLREPPPGIGLFLAFLSEAGFPLLPIALHEDGETLVVRFGQPFRLSARQGAARQEQDRRASAEAMAAIARLLPDRYRGAYASVAAD